MTSIYTVTLLATVSVRAIIIYSLHRRYDVAASDGEEKSKAMKISPHVMTIGALILISGTLASLQLPANVHRRCTPYSEEHNQTVNALICDESFIEDVKEGIKDSTCKNPYSAVLSQACDIRIDSRKNVDNCSEVCSVRQYLYYLCTYIWDAIVEVSKECGVETDPIGICAFDEGDFCFSKFRGAVDLLFGACDTEDSVEECSETCKHAVEQFKDTNGCCVYYFIHDINQDHLLLNSDYSDFSEELRHLFRECDVGISAQCISSSPPQEFLKCAGKYNNNSAVVELSRS